MNRRIKMTLPILLLLLLSLNITNVFHDRARTPQAVAPVSAASDEPEQVLTRFSKYRTWTLVNPVPVIMEPAVAAMCAAILRKPDNPHQNKFLSVYVNDVGQRAMMTELTPKFPQGSMIVKEKLRNKYSRDPELLTAMLKREPGYNPKSGDWEYLVLDGLATKIVERGKLASCSSCHAAYSGTDFVTRRYLTDDVRQRLK